MSRPLHYDAYIFAEVEGIPCDLDQPGGDEIGDLDAIRAAALASGVDIAESCSVYRLAAPFEIVLTSGVMRYPTGALVLHDRQEVVFLEHHGPEACGQRPPGG